MSLTAAENEHSDEFGELSGLFDAEVLFRIGLNQLEDMDELDDKKLFLKASMHRNLGITLLKRGKSEDVSEEEKQALLQEAAQHFQASVNIEKMVVDEGTYPGQGVAYCYIAILDEQNERLSSAKANWQICQQNAHPASLEQYEDILRLGEGSIGLQLNTKHILESNLN